MAQQFLKGHLNLTEQYEENDSMVSESFQEELVYNAFTIQSNTKYLSQQNLNLEYNYFLDENDLALLRKKISEKDNQIRKWKDKIRSKLQKQSDLKKHLEHLQKNKNKKLLKGFKNLHQELGGLKNKQKNVRFLRMNAQEEKNKLYEKYENMQKNFKQLIGQLQQLNGVQQGLDEIECENKNLSLRIQKIEREIEAAHKDEVSNTKKYTIEKVKKLNSTIKDLEDEEKILLAQINEFEVQRKFDIEESRDINEKTKEITIMNRKIQDLKSDLTLKKTEYSHLNSIFKQLSIEESKVKKQKILQRECLEEQRKFREATNRKTHKFQIIDTEADEVRLRQFRKSSSPNKSRDDEELKKIIERYTKLKERS